MGILGIKNRTENWKTAKTFAPFFNKPDLRLKLVERLGEPEGTDPDEVKLELFWKGMRDYIHGAEPKPTEATLAKMYKRMFSDLRLHIGGFHADDGVEFDPLKEWNYSPPHPEEAQALYKNLRNTEIDIVLESKGRIYVGEAKDESGFGANGSLVLVHQLVRQYVMAKILVDLLRTKHEVVPFIVRNNPKDEQKEPAQVQFMLEQKWLQPENILTWKYVIDLAAGHGVTMA